ncbi:MAG: ribosome silencing factor [Spirochaetota bacterium]
MTKEEMRKYVFDVAEMLNSKKAEDIVILDFNQNNDVTDYMIICHAETYLQIRALAKYVEDKMKDEGMKPLNRRTGLDNDPWILLDFVFLVVHIFEKETREFYNIEKLWADAEVINYDEQTSNINQKAQTS